MSTKDLIAEMTENVNKYGGENMTTYLMVQAIQKLSATDAELASLRSERDALRARLDGAVKAAEAVFGQKAIRYKFSLDEDGRPYTILPPEMDGRWYALQPAEDDAHIGLCDEIVRLRSELEAAKQGAAMWETIQSHIEEVRGGDSWMEIEIDRDASPTDWLKSYFSEKVIRFSANQSPTTKPSE
ncbi:hypothetical protein [Curvibacter lanceolatus]|uniref:hypothetical protein n=1 Tax=Curvibacter lanceolatus TaxID=86182 RepID=UPI00036F3118|nr:hypothetical protein [Curvibacter lanceolatus]